MQTIKNGKRYIGFYLDNADYEALIQICKMESRTKSGQVRKLIRDAKEKLRSKAA